MAQSMFGSMYDAKSSGMDDLRDRAYKTGSLGGRGAIIEAATLGGGMLGRGASRAFGALPQAEAKQAKINEMMGQFPNPTTYEEYMTLAGEFNSVGILDVGEHFNKLAQDMKGKSTAAQQQKLDDMDSTLAYLEVNKGFKLNPTEAAYFKSRIKKDVSVTMGGQVIDTAPNVFDQIIAARKNKKQNTGIGDSGITEAGIEKKVGDLSTKVLKADISDLDVALTEVENMFTMYGDRDIPGLSVLNIIERQTEEGGINSGMVEAVKNILLKLRSGAAVTKSEQKRFLNEISGTKVMTDELWKKWIARIRKLVEQKKKDLFAGERKDVLDLYWQRQGTSLKSKATSKQQAVLDKYVPQK